MNNYNDSIEIWPFGTRSVIVRFHCGNCDSRVESEEISVPMPNYAAEKSSDSYNENEGWAICETCGEEYEISVYAGYVDGYIQIWNSYKGPCSVEEIPDEEELDFYIENQIESIISSSNPISLLNTELDNLIKLNELNLNNADLQEILHRQVFSGAITCLESYLSTTLIQHVINEEKYRKRFVETYDVFAKRKPQYSEIFEQYSLIIKTVKKELLDIIYHNLPKVKNIYTNVFRIGFPCIEELSKKISLRHDIVHRNGKDKNGEKLNISQKDVEETIDKVRSFAIEIDQSIHSQAETLEDI